MAAVSPLLFAAWEIGRDHTAARRRGYDLLLGFKEVVRRAFGREPVHAELPDAGKPPRDNPRTALALGVGTAVLVPAFVAGVLPTLRTPSALAWLCGAGILMGSLSYARYRAMAYLRDEPGRFDLFRHYRLMNTERYDRAGHRFVRWQLIGAVLLMIWWLGVGSLVLFSG